MRMTTKKLEPDFTPFELRLTVESRKEAEELYFLFNFVPLIRTLPNVMGETGNSATAVRGLLNKNCPGAGHRHQEIVNKFDEVR